MSTISLEKRTEHAETALVDLLKREAERGAIADLVEAHRSEFEAHLEAQSHTADLGKRRAERTTRSVRRRRSS